MGAVRPVPDRSLTGATPALSDASRGCRGRAAQLVTVTVPKRQTASRAKPERPRLYKVILLNDDVTPQAFVVKVLKAVFRMSGDEAYGVMMTAHQRGACVVAVFTREVAESKATRGTEEGARAGYPLTFTTERED